MPRIMKSLNNISRCQSIYRLDKIACPDLAACHHALVLTICRVPGWSQEELARDLCLNKSTVARTLNQLEERGYVMRTADKDDKRRLLVYPTEKMLAVYPTVRRVTTEWNDMLEKDISAEELAVFHSVLQRMELRAKDIVSDTEGKR